MRITVIGAGNTGLAMISHLALAGNEVVVYDNSSEVVSALNSTKSIRCGGVINDNATIAFASTDISEAISNTDLILIMTPAFAHKDLAARLGASLQKEVPIILNPGRTFGAMKFEYYFTQTNKFLKPIIAETQTVIHTARRLTANKVHLIAIKDSVEVATKDPDKIGEIITALPEVIRPYFKPAKSIIETSIGNVGMILHSTPLLLNSGWTESPEFSFRHYWDGITPRIANYLEKLDFERLSVAKALGSDLLSTKDWIKRSYHSEGETLFECLRNTIAYEIIEAPNTLEHRYIFEDIPYGLVPLELVGINLGIDMHYTTLIIDLASALLEVDFRENEYDLCQHISYYLKNRK